MKQSLSLQGQVYEVELLEKTRKKVRFLFEDKEYEFQLLPSGKIQNTQTLKSKKWNTWSDLEKTYLCSDQHRFEVEPQKSYSSKNESQEKEILSPMPGKILKIFVNAQDQVSQGDSLIILEAMKMEYTMKAQRDTVVEKVLVTEGETVQARAKLMELK